MKHLIILFSLAAFTAVACNDNANTTNDTRDSVSSPNTDPTVQPDTSSLNQHRDTMNTGSDSLNRN